MTAVAITAAFALALTMGLADAGNASANLVAARAGSLRAILGLAFVSHLAGATFAGTAVASSVLSAIDVPTADITTVVAAGAVAAVVLLLFAGRVGIPVERGTRAGRRARRRCMEGGRRRLGRVGRPPRHQALRRARCRARHVRRTDTRTGRGRSSGDGPIAWACAAHLAAHCDRCGARSGRRPRSWASPTARTTVRRRWQSSSRCSSREARRSRARSRSWVRLTIGIVLAAGTVLGAEGAADRQPPPLSQPSARRGHRRDQLGRGHPRVVGGRRAGEHDGGRDVRRRRHWARHSSTACALVDRRTHRRGMGRIPAREHGRWRVVCTVFGGDPPHAGLMVAGRCVRSIINPGRWSGARG